VGLGSPAQRVDVTRYHLDGTVQATIANYQDGLPDPQLPAEDVVTSYGYDALGRPIWVRDALGHYQATHYDALSRVDWTVQNLTGFSGGTSLPALPPAFSPSQPDANVATFTRYDGLGRVTETRQTGLLSGTFSLATRQFSQTGERRTRTAYDALSRPITVTLNYQDGAFDPARPDEDLQSLTRYDGAGNVSWQRDPFGRWTHTQYDALSRPITVTLNYGDARSICGDGSGLGVCDPGEDNRSWATLSDTDQIQC
jgi:YD repeat-containing protein